MRNESSSDTVATFAAYGLAKVARPGHARCTARLANPERDIARLAMATTAVPSVRWGVPRRARPRSHPSRSVERTTADPVWGPV